MGREYDCQALEIEIEKKSPYFIYFVGGIVTLNLLLSGWAMVEHRKVSEDLVSPTGFVCCTGAEYTPTGCTGCSYEDYTQKKYCQTSAGTDKAAVALMIINTVIFLIVVVYIGYSKIYLRAKTAKTAKPEKMKVVITEDMLEEAERVKASKQPQLLLRN
jgi:hypothetical protein